MAKYRITAPDGNSYEITAPDTASQDQVLSYAKANYQKAAGPDWKGVVGGAVKEAFMQPGTISRDMQTNPVTQAKALPPLLGAAGALSPIPGGATLGTVGGRQLSNLALRSYGKPEEIPSTGSQIAEGGLSALGDIAAIPALKKSYFGGQIGKAEQAAGMANIEKEAPPSGARTAVKFIQGLKNKMNANAISPQEARSIKPALDMIHRKGWLAGTEYGADLAQISQRVSSVVNQIPGRAAPAAAMARSQMIPNAIRNTWQAIPQPVKYGLGVGAGASAPIGVYEILKKLLGGQ